MTNGKTRWSSVLLGLSLGVLAAYHHFKLPPVLPILLGDHGYDKLLAGGLMSIYALAGLLLSAPLGLLLQRIGIRLMILPAASFFVVGSLISVLASENEILFLVGRGMEGIGFTICAVAGPVVAIGAAQGHQLPIVVGIYATWIPAGQLLALGAAFPAIAANQWKLLWYIGLAATVGITIAVLTFSRSTSPPDRKLAAAHVSKHRASDRNWHRGLLLVAIIFSLWSAQMFAFLTWLPHYLVEVWSMDVFGAITPYAIPAALILVFNIIGGLLLRRGVPLGGLLVGSLLLQALVWLLLPNINGTIIGIIGLILFGIGGGITPACLFAAPNTISGHGSGGGAVFGVIMTGRNLGVFVGPILVPTALSMLGDWDLVTPIFGGIAFAAALGGTSLGLMLKRVKS